MDLQHFTVQFSLATSGGSSAVAEREAEECLGHFGPAFKSEALICSISFIVVVLL